MDNKTATPKETDKNAHSNVRKGLEDYNDGSNVTHYLGNSDYEGNNLPDYEKEENLSGREANGNELTETEEDDGDATKNEH